MKGEAGERRDGKDRGKKKQGDWQKQRQDSQRGVAELDGFLCKNRLINKVKLMKSRRLEDTSTHFSCHLFIKISF